MSASKIIENLWIGGTPPLGSAVGQLFDKLILADERYQPDGILFQGVHVLHVPLYDAEPTPKEAVLAVQAGRAVAGWLRRDKRVLVTCAEGLNRAALIAAIALMTQGSTSLEAIKKVREARGSFALHNTHYVSLLRRLEDARDFYVSSGI